MENKKDKDNLSPGEKQIVFIKTEQIKKHLNSLDLLIKTLKSDFSENQNINKSKWIDVMIKISVETNTELYDILLQNKDLSIPDIGECFLNKLQKIDNSEIKKELIAKWKLLYKKNFFSNFLKELEERYVNFLNNTEDLTPKEIKEFEKAIRKIEQALPFLSKETRLELQSNIDLYIKTMKLKKDDNFKKDNSF